MRYLFSHLAKIKKTIKDKRLFLFLDYDGTLVPIRRTPGQASILPKAKRLLEGLSKNKKIRLAVVSGRSLSDIKSKIGLSNVIYSGNHGLEVSGSKLSFKAPLSKEYKIILRRIKIELKDKLSSLRGIIIEEKGYCLALHFRQAHKSRLPFVKSTFRKITRPYLSGKKIMVTAGKMVFDIRPLLKWNKGKVVTMLLKAQAGISENKTILPVYLGDDQTDEDAFYVLKAKGITVYVGKAKKSYAGYYLKDSAEVLKFLKIILKGKDG